jgi:hypothetical protein
MLASKDTLLRLGEALVGVPGNLLGVQSGVGSSLGGIVVVVGGGRPSESGGTVLGLLVKLLADPRQFGPLSAFYLLSGSQLLI